MKKDLEDKILESAEVIDNADNLETLNQKGMMYCFRFQNKSPDFDEDFEDSSFTFHNPDDLDELDCDAIGFNYPEDDEDEYCPEIDDEDEYYNALYDEILRERGEERVDLSEKSGEWIMNRMAQLINRKEKFDFDSDK